jgi:hypothetical protein
MTFNAKASKRHYVQGMRHNANFSEMRLFIAEAPLRRILTCTLDVMPHSVCSSLGSHGFLKNSDPHNK